jgi:hypothetical protein
MRSRHIFLVLLSLVALGVSRPVIADDRPRQVLIIDSFAHGIAPLNEYMLAFRSELRDRWPGPLDMSEMSLESARSPDPQGEGSIVNFVAAHLARDPVDLVAVFGEPPAMRFAARHRGRLFPDVRLPIGRVEQHRLLLAIVGSPTATFCDRFDPALIDRAPFPFDGKIEQFELELE